MKLGGEDLERKGREVERERIRRWKEGDEGFARGSSEILKRRRNQDKKREEPVGQSRFNKDQKRRTQVEERGWKLGISGE